MASKKRNEWLEADLEDEEVLENSDEQEAGRSWTVSRSTKRRKLDPGFISASEESDNDEDADELKAEIESPRLDKDIGSVIKQSRNEKPEKKSKVERKLAKTRDATSRSGVIYISHIPPFMKPHTLKNLLSPFAPSGLRRIYLTPEDQERRQARVRAGGNKKRNFVDGWVEFVSKKEAKAVVETLNTRTIGGKKGGYYFDDVWNLKYLRGFKWRHLTEQIANENEERAARMRAEASKSKREMREFLRNVEKARIEEKKVKLSLDENADTVTRTKMGFDQSIPITSRKRPKQEDEEIKDRVLSQIF